MLKKRIVFATISITVLVVAVFLGSKYILDKDEVYALMLNDVVITPQIYHAHVIQKVLLARDVTDSETDLVGKEIDGIPVSDWVEAKALEQIIYDYVVKAEWDKREINVGSFEQEQMDTYLALQWETKKEIFENNQCGVDIFNEIHQNNLYGDLMFDDYLAKNPPEDTESMPSVQVASVKHFIANKYGLDGRMYSEKETEKLMALVEGYVKELKDGKSIDEAYKNYLIQMNEESSSHHPIATTIISSDNPAYTSKIPNFVDALMKTKSSDPFYIEDEYHITIGIRQEDADQEVVQQAYADDALKKVNKEKFDEYIKGITKGVKVKRNDYVIKKFSADSIKLSEI